MTGRYSACDCWNPRHLGAPARRAGSLDFPQLLVGCWVELHDADLIGPEWVRIVADQPERGEPVTAVANPQIGIILLCPVALAL
jgi:hypothetical protein